MKLKYSILEKLKNLTKREFDFLLHIARYQDERGCVEGIHYKDICKETGMCKQTFYNVLRRLVDRGVIKYQKVTELDYDIQILENDFSGMQEAYKEGYIMLNRQLFRSKKFKQLKAKEKYLLFDLMKITHSNSGTYKISRVNFYKKYTEQIGVSMRVIRYYLHRLKEYFSVKIMDGMYVIGYLAGKFLQNKESALQQCREHTARVLIRRAGFKVVLQKNVWDLSDMIRQYSKRAETQGHNIKNLLRMLLEKVRTEEGEVVFRPKRVHMLLKECLV